MNEILRKKLGWSRPHLWEPVGLLGVLAVACSEFGTVTVETDELSIEIGKAVVYLDQEKAEVFVAARVPYGKRALPVCFPLAHPDFFEWLRESLETAKKFENEEAWLD